MQLFAYYAFFLFSAREFTELTDNILQIFVRNLYYLARIEFSLLMQKKAFRIFIVSIGRLLRVSKK